jgi:hypothetical protein
VACSYRDNVCPFCRTPSNNKQKIKLFDWFFYKKLIILLHIKIVYSYP